MSMSAIFTFSACLRDPGSHLILIFPTCLVLSQFGGATLLCINTCHWPSGRWLSRSGLLFFWSSTRSVWSSGLCVQSSGGARALDVQWMCNRLLISLLCGGVNKSNYTDPISLRYQIVKPPFYRHAANWAHRVARVLQFQHPSLRYVSWWLCSATLILTPWRVD